MANITISNLHLNGSDLFMDSEGFMMDLVDNELTLTHGGSSTVCVTIFLTITRHCRPK